MPTELEQLRLLLKNGDTYNISDKLDVLFPDKHQRNLVFWDLIRNDAQDPYWVQRKLWSLVDPADPCYSAQDLFQLWSEILRLTPDGTLWSSRGGWGLWNAQILVGLSDSLLNFLEARSNDKAFLDAFGALIPGFPAQYQSACWYQLHRVGAAPLSVLPPTVLHDAATTYLRTLSVPSSSWSREPRPYDVWPADVWWPKVKTIALAQTALERSEILLPLAQWATPQELMALMGKFQKNMVLEGIFKEILPQKDAFLPLLEETLSHSEVNVSHTWLHLAFLKELALPVPEGLYERLAQVVEATHQETVYKWLAWLPIERREALVLAPRPKWLFWLARVAPTPKVAAAQLDKILALPTRSSYEEEMALSHVRADLEPLGAVLVPFLLSTLQTYKGPLRQTFLKFVGTFPDPAVCTFFGQLLLDASKPMRALAIESLLNQDHAQVLSLLDGALASKKKDIRISAAQLLERLPLGPQTVALAERTLKTEKAAEVIAILEKMVTKSSDPMDTALVESMVGNLDWKPHVARGDELVAAFFRAVSQTYKDQAPWEHKLPTANWVALLEQFPAADRAPAIQAATIFYHYGVSGWLDKLAELSPSLIPDIVAMVGNGQIVRPDEAGKADKTGTWEHVAAWLCDRPEPEALSGVVYGLNAKDKKVREKVAETLHRVGAAALPLVLKVLDTIKPAEGKDIALLFLAQFGDLDVLPAIQRLQDHKSAPVALAKLMERFLLQKDYTDAELDALLGAFMTSLPPQGGSLRWKSGAPLSASATSALVGALKMESEEVENRALLGVCNRLHPDDKQTLADKHAEDYTGYCSYYYMIPLLSDLPRIEAIGRAIEGVAKRAPREFIKAILRSDSDVAVRWLDHWSRKSKHNSTIGHCQTALATMAARRGCGVEELIEAATEDFGFNRQGERVLDYGPRTITARIDAIQGLVFVDEKGAVHTSLPKARVNDDAAKVAAIKELDLKKRITEVSRSILAGLEQAMSRLDGWSEAVWRQRFVDHALRYPYSVRLLWQDAVGFFALAEDGTPITETGDIRALVEPIRLAHPDALSDADRAFWRQHFLDYKLIQPILQIERPPVVLPPHFDIYLAALPAITGFQLVGRLGKLYLSQGPREDGGFIFYCYRRVGRKEVRIYHSAFSMQLGEEECTCSKVEVCSGDMGDTVETYADQPEQLQKDIVYWVRSIWAPV